MWLIPVLRFAPPKSESEPLGSALPLSSEMRKVSEALESQQ
jgi:hypothetical protein